MQNEPLIDFQLRVILLDGTTQDMLYSAGKSYAGAVRNEDDFFDFLTSVGHLRLMKSSIVGYSLIELGEKNSDAK